VGPALGSQKVRRGGAWDGDLKGLRSAKRLYFSKTNRFSFLGFRLAFQKIQPDTANPEIQLIGGNTITHSQGMPFTDPGAEAHDVRDGNITSQLAVAGSVDVNSTGTYLLTYTVQDGAGNPATATRTVTVVGNRTVDLNATVAMDMIWCPPGTFTMGSPSEEVGRRADREDEHNVTLTQGFYLGKYEVTQAQYEAITGLNPSEFSGVSKKNRPVEKLRWAEAVAFCNQLTLQERNADLIPSDWEYVLPTESQWEYACRAGSTKAYSWGDVIASTNANYGNIIGQTSNVGNYAANPWGFFDMNGNVWEFTADAFLANYPTGSLVIDPTNPGTTGSRRVRRGGSWSSQQSELRSSERGHGNPSNRFNDLGFRVSLQKSQ
jgi:formylglycine-generating enzyme required for sulfatase activity